MSHVKKFIRTYADIEAQYQPAYAYSLTKISVHPKHSQTRSYAVRHMGACPMSGIIFLIKYSNLSLIVFVATPYLLTLLKVSHKSIVVDNEMTG